MTDAQELSQTESEVQHRIRDAGIIAIVRGNFPLDRLPLIGEALARGGVHVMEVTLNSAGALNAIALVRESLGEAMLVGAGTVRTPEDVDSAVRAGARFLVSPSFHLESVTRSRAAGVPHLPGVFTASEAQGAYAAGCTLVKLFPADALGPSYLKALRAPLDDVEFVAVGGIDAGNLADYVRAGAVAVGVGSSLVSGREEQELAEITRRAAALVQALRQGRAA
jgi:2-dehydro-3-deoxyphosphogluconate aldolase / (4S)-4-hydroxy-2-oxoglutarate aldolase